MRHSFLQKMDYHVNFWVVEPNSPSKDALKNDGCPLLINFSSQGNSDNVGLFAMFPHLW
jgi:hypothetical protein